MTHELELVFWQNLKQTDKKPQYELKVLEKFQGLSYFFEENVFLFLDQKWHSQDLN